MMSSIKRGPNYSGDEGEIISQYRPDNLTYSLRFNTERQVNHIRFSSVNDYMSDPDIHAATALKFWMFIDDVNNYYSLPAI